LVNLKEKSALPTEQWGICYHCGKELDELLRCPYCNLSFCEDHIQQRAHNCFALSGKLNPYTERARLPNQP
jgi:predicted nucleic acid binding AN1-type Zn finger protein